MEDCPAGSRGSRLIRAAPQRTTANVLTRLPNRTRHWLDDFALFMALKEQHQRRGWTQLGAGCARTRPRSAGQVARTDWLSRSRSQKVSQFVFFDSVARVARVLPRARRADHGRSANLCCARQRRRLGQSTVLSVGRRWAIPRWWPAFRRIISAQTGQLWGNPIYRWDVLASDGYRWWLDRFRATL